MTLSNLNTLCHTFQIALRVLQAHNIGMISQTTNHVHWNRHVCRSQNIVKHQRSRDAIGQRLVILIHLLWRQSIIGRQGGYNDICPQGTIYLCLTDLFTETVTGKPCINQYPAICCLYCLLHKKLPVSLTHAIAFSRCSHQKGRDFVFSKEINYSFYGLDVKLPILSYRSHHRHHHTTILTVVHTL